MALTLSDVGLEAKDQGVLKCAWIVQINGVVVFETKIHSCQITIMRSVRSFKNEIALQVLKRYLKYLINIFQIVFRERLVILEIH